MSRQLALCCKSTELFEKDVVLVLLLNCLFTNRGAVHIHSDPNQSKTNKSDWNSKDYLEEVH